jgi:hypothetical protein
MCYVFQQDNVLALTSVDDHWMTATFAGYLEAASLTSKRITSERSCPTTASSDVGELCIGSGGAAVESLEHVSSEQSIVECLIARQTFDVTIYDIPLS